MGSYRFDEWTDLLNYSGMIFFLLKGRPPPPPPLSLLAPGYYFSASYHIENYSAVCTCIVHTIPYGSVGFRSLMGAKSKGVKSKRV